MIVNVVGNAIKFTQSGEVVVSVSEDETTESSPATRRLHFQVRDTGIGIPEQKLTSIFSAFHQADSSTTRKFGGTGLGLTITQQLAKAMGGRIWVDSVLGSGSTFHFTIQLEAIDEPKLKPMLPDSLSILAVVV
jgi:two-component system sensor histidine kinase/response regulator